MPATARCHRPMDAPLASESTGSWGAASHALYRAHKSLARLLKPSGERPIGTTGVAIAWPTPRPDRVDRWRIRTTGPLCAMGELGVGDNVFVVVKCAGHSDGPTIAERGIPPTVSTCLRPCLAVDARREEESMRRREMLTLTGGAIAGSLLVPVEHTRRLVGSSLKCHPLLDAEELEHVAYEYSRLVGKTLPAVVLPRLFADFDEMRARIEAASGEVRERLIRAAGYSAH